MEAPQLGLCMFKPTELQVTHEENTLSVSDGTPRPNFKKETLRLSQEELEAEML